MYHATEKRVRDLPITLENCFSESKKRFNHINYLVCSLKIVQQSQLKWFVDDLHI